VFAVLALKVAPLRVSGALVFQLKKRPPDYQGRKGRKVDDKGDFFFHPNTATDSLISCVYIAPHQMCGVSDQQHPSAAASLQGEAVHFVFFSPEAPVFANLATFSPAQ